MPIPIQIQNEVFGPVAEAPAPSPAPGPTDRITEDGQQLVTEAGENRIIE